MKQTIQALRNKLEQRKGKQAQLEQTLTNLKSETRELKRSMRRHEEAREVIREVGLSTQSQLSFHISDLASLALSAVFPNPYELKVDFVQRRNKTECDLLFVRDEKILDPIDSSGVGAIDIASFALRIASWSMATPRSRNVIILDEPMKFLSVDYQHKASAMLKEISDKLGIQFIIITHEETLTESADKTFHVSMRKKVSKVT